jgi:hypothetical protein
MAKKIILSQRSSQVQQGLGQTIQTPFGGQIVKKLNDSYSYVNSFGTFGTVKSDNTGLNFPAGIAADSSNNIYICDSKNLRIIKLNSNLSFIASVYVSSTLGKPYSIMFDNVTNNFYIVGIYNNYQISIAKMSTSLVISKYSNNIYKDIKNKIYGISKGFNSDEFIIAIGNKLISTIENTNSFTNVGIITNETITPTNNDVIENRKIYYFANKSMMPSSYTIFKKWTEFLLHPTSTTILNTTKFPILGTPDIDFKIYVNQVQLDYNPLLNTNNDYNINQTNGQITTSFTIKTDDIIAIRYKYQMVENVDYILNLPNSTITLQQDISQDWLSLTDTIIANYSYYSTANSIIVIGEENSTFTGVVKHSINNKLYASVVKDNIGKIITIDSSYINTGDSDNVSKSIIGLTQATDGTLLTYDNDNESIIRYDQNLNFVEIVYTDTGNTVSTDAYDICGIVELPI